MEGEGKGKARKGKEKGREEKERGGVGRKEEGGSLFLQLY